jgi:hypothetical protein
MASTIMSAYEQFDSLVRERALTTSMTRMNLAQKQDYALSGFIKHKKALRSGKYFTEKVKVAVGGNFGTFVPGSVHTSSRTNTTQTLSWAPSIYLNSVPRTEQELIYSEGNTQEVQFKNFRKSLGQDLTVAHWEGLENLLFAVPDSTAMETLTLQGNSCFSVLAYISENSSTYLPPSSVWSASTVAQMNPATYSVWRNALKTYNSAQPSHPTEGLFSAFGRASSAIDFTAPTGADLGDGYTKDGMEKLMIWTNEDGENIYADLARSGQDQFRGGTNASDPSYAGINWRGKKIRKSTALRDNALEEAAGSYTGNAYPAGKPRFFFINGEFTYLSFHERKFMDRYSETGGARQPGTTVEFMESHPQLICVARNRNAVVYPA